MFVSAGPGITVIEVQLHHTHRQLVHIARVDPVVLADTPWELTLGRSLVLVRPVFMCEKSGQGLAGCYASSPWPLVLPPFRSQAPEGRALMDLSNLLPLENRMNARSRQA
jgi:hypothetical protein